MNNEYFSFEVTAKSSECFARTGVFKTPHGEIETPILQNIASGAAASFPQARERPE